MLSKARHQLDQEIDIYFVVRLHRFLYAAVVDLLNEEQRYDLWMRTRFALIDDESKDQKDHIPSPKN